MIPGKATLAPNFSHLFSLEENVLRTFGTQCILKRFLQIRQQLFRIEKISSKNFPPLKICYNALFIIQKENKNYLSVVTFGLWTNRQHLDIRRITEADQIADELSRWAEGQV